MPFSAKIQLFDKIKRNKHPKNDNIKRNDGKTPHPSPLITPNLRAASYLGIEDAIELGTGGEATLQGDDIIAIAGVLSHHLLRRLKADVAEPDAKTRLYTLVEIKRKV